ncbi:hypothetical protein ACFLXH_02595 [Chloroflexota bacterium]
MTNEELAQEIKEVQESLRELSQSEKPPGQEEKKWQKELTMRKLVLEKITEAKQKQRTSDEIYHNIFYSFLKSGWAEKHPFLTSILLRKFRWSLDTSL